MNPEAINTLYEYNYWAFERVWKCVVQLSDEQFVEEIDYSIGSVRNIIVHIMSGTNRWVERLQRNEISPHLSFEDYNTLSKTKAKWNEMRSEVLDYISSLTQEQLDVSVHWELPARGMQLDNYHWEILLHVVNHATDHRSQILAILSHHFNIETVEQDMLFFFIERNQK